MQDSFRKSHVALVCFGPLAVAAAVATFKAGRPYVLTGAQLTLSDTGAGAGNTSAVVKVNGVAVVPTLSIAGAAPGPNSVYAAASSGTPAPYPSGLALRAGDVVTVDITAVPAGAAPKGGVVQLDMVEVDV